MADVVESLRALMLTKSAITDVVSTRIRPGNLAYSDTMPAITLENIDAQTAQGLGGYCAGAGSALVDVRCYSDDYSEATALAETVKDEVPTSGTFGSLVVKDVTLNSRRDLPPLSPSDGNDNWRYAVLLEFQISYTE